MWPRIGRFSRIIREKASVPLSNLKSNGQTCGRGRMERIARNAPISGEAGWAAEIVCRLVRGQGGGEFGSAGNGLQKSRDLALAAGGGWRGTRFVQQRGELGRRPQRRPVGII